MPRYKTIVDEVEALQITAENGPEVQKFVGQHGDVRPFEDHEEAVVLYSDARGIEVGTAGDFVVRDITGFHIWKEGVFKAKFELVAPAAAAK